MPQHARHRAARTHALRLDPPAILEGGIAATISLLVAWIIQAL